MGIFKCWLLILHVDKKSQISPTTQIYILKIPVRYFLGIYSAHISSKGTSLFATEKKSVI